MSYSKLISGKSSKNTIETRKVKRSKTKQNPVILENENAKNIYTDIENVKKRQNITKNNEGYLVYNTK